MARGKRRSKLSLTSSCQFSRRVFIDQNSLPLGIMVYIVSSRWGFEFYTRNSRSMCLIQNTLRLVFAMAMPSKISCQARCIPFFACYPFFWEWKIAHSLSRWEPCFYHDGFAERRTPACLHEKCFSTMTDFMITSYKTPASLPPTTVTTRVSL